MFFTPIATPNSVLTGILSSKPRQLASLIVGLLTIMRKNVYMSVPGRVLIYNGDKTTWGAE